jgi:inner membrane protein
MILGICLVLLNLFLFILLQLQDYALLLGSIGLFIAMGMIMFTSRKNRDKQIGF